MLLKENRLSDNAERPHKPEPYQRERCVHYRASNRVYAEIFLRRMHILRFPMFSGDPSPDIPK